MKWLDKLVVKAIKNITSDVNKGLFEFVGNQPVYIEQSWYEYIKEGYEGNPDLNAVVNKKGGLQSSVPWELVEVDKEGNETVITDHEILELWKKPNESQGGYEFRKELFAFKDVTGNAYIHGTGPTNGKNKHKWESLNLMPPQHVTIISGGWKRPIDYYQLDLNSTRKYPVEEVCHLRDTNLTYEGGSSLYGMSRLKAGIRSLTASNSGYDAQVSSLQNGGLKGFISGRSNDSQHLGVEQIKSLKDSLRASGKRNDIHVTNADITWNAMGLSPVDMEVLDSLNLNLKTFCNLYGLSDLLFSNSDGKTFSNYKEALKAAYTEVVMPELKNLQDCLHQWWISGYEEREGKKYIFRPDYSDVEVLQENMVEKAKWLLSSVWLTMNEKREQMGFPRIDNPEFDVPWIPMGIAPYTQESESTQEDEDILKQLGLSEYDIRK